MSTTSAPTTWPPRWRTTAERDVTTTRRTAATSRRGAMHPAFFFVVAALCVAMLATCTGRASAHFLLNINIRVFHVVHEQGRIRLLVRLPMPYLVADKLGPEAADGTRAPAPYTTNRIERLAGNTEARVPEPVAEPARLQRGYRGWPAPDRAGHLAHRHARPEEISEVELPDALGRGAAVHPVGDDLDRPARDPTPFEPLGTSAPRTLVGPGP